MLLCQAIGRESLNRGLCSRCLTLKGKIWCFLCICSDVMAVSNEEAGDICSGVHVRQCNVTVSLSSPC